MHQILTPYKHSNRRSLSVLLLLLFLPFCVLSASAQGDDGDDGDEETTEDSDALPVITIGGSVYGGGNAGKVEGNTNVTLRAGDLNKVYGGARMADVGGHAFVNVDGENATNYILVNNVFGGNDISGTVGTKPKDEQTDLPKELTAVEIIEGSGKITENKKNDIDKSWNAFVRITSNVSETDETDQVGKVYLGQLFGGGNGDYDYTTESTAGVENPYYGLSKPELGKTYLEIVGGSIVYAFGGGNNATVTGQTVIHVDNPSKVVNSIIDKNNPHAGEDGELLTDNRIKEMGYNPGFTHPTSADFQIGSFFGGNNKATMAIRPRWNLRSGLIRNIYSGGNKGAMTSKDGLILDIDPDKDKVFKVDNVFGGCRMADVHPDVPDSDLPSITLNEDPYKLLPAGLPARVLVQGGDINNVYGGNDITGRVYGGNTLGVYTSIRGNVFGGGNGAYPYTDNQLLKDDPVYGDLYYGTYNSDAESLEALNNFRPNAEQVSIRLHSGDQTNPTIIRNSVYLGGDCATLKNLTGMTKPRLELRIGSWVYVENLFLGNNGEGMVKTDYTSGNAAYAEGVLYTMQSRDKTSDGSKFNSIDLILDATNFEKYMDGCAMELIPSSRR